MKTIMSISNVSNHAIHLTTLRFTHIIIYVVKGKPDENRGHKAMGLNLIEDMAARLPAFNRPLKKLILLMVKINEERLYRY